MKAHLISFLALLLSCFVLMSLISVSANTKTKDYNILNYGAKADGMTLNTSAIQNAIDDAARAGGGRVVIPEGTYLTGSIVLKSNIDFHLDEKALIRGSAKIKDYGEQEKIDTLSNALFYAEDVTNLSITGKGEIDGQGRKLAHHLDSLFYLGEWKKSWDYNTNTPTPESRITLMRIRDAKNVTISGIIMSHSNSWVFEAIEIENLTIKNVKVDSDDYWNNDGFDIIDCKDVIVSNCDVNSADDGICLKSQNYNKIDENVLIENCRVRSSASAIKFGTSSYGGFKNITVRNIDVYDTYRSAIAIECVDGGILENVLVENFTVTNSGNAIFIRLGKRRVNPNCKSILKNVHIRNMKAQIAYGRPDGEYDVQGPPVDGFYNTFPASITGIPGFKVENVKLENIDIIMPGKGNDGLGWSPLYRLDAIPEKENRYPEYDMFRELPAWAMYVRHVDGIEFENINFIANTPDYRPAYVFDDVNDLKMEGISIMEADNDPQIILKNVHNEEIEFDKKFIRYF